MTRIKTPIKPEEAKLRTESVRLLYEENPGLAMLVAGAFQPAKDGGTKSVNAMADSMVTILHRAGHVKDIHDIGDFTKGPELFWDLLEAARAENPAEGGTLELQALLRLYRRLSYTVTFPEEYIRNDKSPLCILTLPNEKVFSVLGDHAVTRDTYFAVAFRKKPLTLAPLKMSYRSGYLLSRVVRTLNGNELFMINRNHTSCKKFAEGFEQWFDDSEKIRSYTDFTVARMDAVVRKMCDTLGSETERYINLNFLFWMWRDLLQDFPDYDFFRGSLCYNAELVMNCHAPMYLAQGYRLMAVSDDEDGEVMDKILFVVRRNMDRTANGLYYGMQAVDLSDVMDPVWKKALMNYTMKLVYRGNKTTFNHVRAILIQMLYDKAGDGQPHCVLKRDARMIVYNILVSSKKERTKIGDMSQIRCFLRWAVAAEYVTEEPGAVESIKGPKTRYVPNPRVVPLENMAKVDMALREMETESKNPLYGLTRCLMHIQLLSEVRMGQICALRVSCLSFNDDDSSIAIQKGKNTGRVKDEFYFNPEATEYIREAMDLSRPLRNRCPRGTMKDNVFVYSDLSHPSRRYLKFNTRMINRNLARACERAGVEPFTTGNIRDTMMTYAKKLAKRVGLTEAEMRVLTGHACPMSSNFYYYIDFRDILKAADGITLGTVKQC